LLSKGSKLPVTFFFVFTLLEVLPSSTVKYKLESLVFMSI